MHPLQSEEEEAGEVLAPGPRAVQHKEQILWGQAGLGSNADSEACKPRGVGQICSFSEPSFPCL